MGLVDFRHALGHQSGNHQRSAGAQVGGGDGCAMQIGHAVNDGGAIHDAHLRAHAGDFAQVAQTVLVDGFLHGGFTLGGGQQGRHGLLQVRGEARVHLGLDVDRPVHAVGDHADGVILLDDAHAHFQKLGGQRLHVGGDAAANGHVAMGGGSGDHQRASLDLIGNDRIGRAVEMLLTADADHIRAGALDLRAHGVEEVGQINDMGLLGSVVDGGVALGLDCRHHHVDGAAHGHHIKEHVTADKLVRLGNDAAAHGIHLGAQGLKALDVLVNGAGADGTSAGEVDLRLTTAA